MQQGEELAAELKQRLIEAEAKGLAEGADPGLKPKVHEAKSGSRVAPPYWICQPRVRDLEKDQRVMAEARARDAESHEERKAAKKAAKLAKAAAAVVAANGAPATATATLTATATVTPTATAAEKEITEGGEGAACSVGDEVKTVGVDGTADGSNRCRNSDNTPLAKKPRVDAAV